MCSILKGYQDIQITLHFEDNGMKVEILLYWNTSYMTNLVLSKQCKWYGSIEFLL